MMSQAHGQRYDLTTIASIWNRRRAPPRVSPAIVSHAQAFAQDEARVGVNGVWKSLDVFWLNHPDANYAADNKPYQLRVAQQCGMIISSICLTLYRYYVTLVTTQHSNFPKREEENGSDRRTCQCLWRAYCR